MASCKFERYGWKCPLEAEDRSNYCYWHQEIDKKKPTSEQLIELISQEINFVYLRKGNLYEADLRGVSLIEANLQGANLRLASLQKASLIYANLRGADLNGANLQGADLLEANLKGANLRFANLQKVSLINANLQRTDLFQADLQEADLIEANLQKADLIYAKLQGANLTEAKMEGADLKHTVFDSNSRIEEAKLKNANLHLSYIDFTKSFRNACFFEQEDLDEREINERIADSIVDNSSLYQYKFDILFDLNKIEQFVYDNCNGIGKYLFYQVKSENKIKQVIRSSSDSKYMLYSDILNFFEDIGSTTKSKKLKSKVNNLLFREEMEHSFFYNSIYKKYSNFVRVSSNNHFLCSDVSKVELYEASKEVYSKLHHFYLNEGMIFREKHAHYRRGEVDRKLLLVRHRWDSSRKGLQDGIRSWLFDWLVLKMLTGYGESILRPVLISIFWIITFGFIYMALEGVKVADRAANWFDYFYLSMTTFTSLGFADVQPNVSVIGMQPLIMAESTMGVAMVALIIFVITYQISR
ncbi:MAG: pentapeptide repeat-containing protein [Methanomethylovorans sp.]|uniref:pentapeptide repeat-containing protein n=1 Tax=Methanomethylovorans sp. TaxID=2758717 RepID=UPI0035312F29